MTSELSTLRLQPAVHTHTVVERRKSYHPRTHFLDFVIDDASLVEAADSEGNLVTELNRATTLQTPPVVDTLLGRRPAPYLEAGRVPLLVCAACGDLACGAITATLDVGATEVTWSAFRWENGYEDPAIVDSLTEPIRFDRAQYEAELADADQRVAALPESEPWFSKPDERGRQFRWP